MKKRWLRVGLVLLAVLWTGLSFTLGMRLGSAPQVEDVAQTSAVSESQEDPMQQFRTEREQLRQMQLSQLNEMIYGGNADAELIALAQQRQLDLMEWMEQEQTLEGILRLREFDDALVTVHTDSVNVMVRTQLLTRQQSAVILELVMRETGISGGNVKIIPIN